MNANMKKKMAMLKKKWKGAKERSKELGSGQEVPDGKYRTRLVEASGPEESQSSGRLQFKMVFEILDGDYVGQKLYRYQGLEPGKNSNQDYEDVLAYALRDIALFGYEMEDIDQLEEVLEEIQKEQPEVVIKVVTKNDFTNYHIGEVTGVEADEDDEEEEELEDEEEVEEGDEEEEDEETEDDESEEEESDEEDEDEDEEEIEEDPEEEPEDDEEEEDEEEDDDEESVELDVGSYVSFEVRGKEVTGEIVKIISDEKVKVKASNGKTYPVSVDDLEPCEPPKAAPKSTAKVQRKKPAAKKAPAKKATAKKAAKKATRRK